MFLLAAEKPLRIQHYEALFFFVDCPGFRLLSKRRRYDCVSKTAVGVGVIVLADVEPVGVIFQLWFVRIVNAEVREEVPLVIKKLCVAVMSDK